MRVAPGVLGRQRVVGQHHPGAERRGQPGGVPHLERVDRADEAAAVQVDDGAGRRAAARGSACTPGSRPAGPRGPRRTAGRSSGTAPVGKLRSRVACQRLEAGPLGLRARRARATCASGAPRGRAARGGGDGMARSVSQPAARRCLVGRQQSDSRKAERCPAPARSGSPRPRSPALYGAMMKLFAKRMLGGEFPDNGYVYFHHKPVLKAVMSASRARSRSGTRSTRTSSPTPSWPAPA